jgi:ribulose-5-phosphate 4-epimerase/fuculose-1-phosphate aldolase
MGVYPNGVGFGNVSVRDGRTRILHHRFGDGGLAELTPTDCVRVVAYDFARNWLSYEGLRFHHRIVDACRDLRIRSIDSAVIHCHDSVLWATLLDRVPTTSKAVAYGTPEMAYEIMRCSR